MLRTTHQKIVQIPHGVAVAAALLALSAWGLDHQEVRQSASHVVSQQEEVAQAAVQEGSRALLDVGALLLLRTGGH